MIFGQPIKSYIALPNQILHGVVTDNFMHAEEISTQNGHPKKNNKIIVKIIK